MDENEYALNFVIPAGPTGPQPISDVCFISYSEVRTNGNLPIQSSKVFPQNNSCYKLGTDSVTVAKGVYELTFCGCIEKSVLSDQVLLSLRVAQNNTYTTLPDMGIKLQSITETRFSTTGVFEFPSDIKLETYLGRVGTGSLSATSVNLLIKKLSN